jgi:long-chain fatty acid transport protein
MKNTFKVFAVLFFVVTLSTSAFATNGTNLIGIGPIARSMGGVGIAAPQDAISAVFANPAAMCFGPYCPSSEFNFSGTLFMPKPEAKETTLGTTAQADSDDKVYMIPAIGISAPIGTGPRSWRFGLSAYGVSGLGVDYRDTSLDQGMGEPGTYTHLAIMKFAPAIAFQPNQQVSLGFAPHINYSTVDLESGNSFNYGFGAQVGAIYKPVDSLSLGVTYISGLKVDHENVTFDPLTGRRDDLELESPQQLGFGVAFHLMGSQLLLEADAKWVNWADAEGYEDFDWDDQWVFAVGAQFEAMPNLFLRAGYNYGENPVKEHNGFGDPFGYFERLRIIGFPAIVESHLTLGFGYQFSPAFSLDLGYVHAFEETIKESGTLMGQPATFESSLSEDSLDFGLTWRF